MGEDGSNSTALLVAIVIVALVVFFPSAVGKIGGALLKPVMKFMAVPLGGATLLTVAGGNPSPRVFVVWLVFTSIFWTIYLSARRSRPRR